MSLRFNRNWPGLQAKFENAKAYSEVSHITFLSQKQYEMAHKKRRALERELEKIQNIEKEYYRLWNQSSNMVAYMEQVLKFGGLPYNCTPEQFAVAEEAYLEAGNPSPEPWEG